MAKKAGIFFGVLWFFVVVSLSSCSEEKIALSEYESKMYGFSIHTPLGWNVVEDEYQVLLSTDENEMGGLVMIITNIPANVRIDEIFTELEYQEKANFMLSENQLPENSRYITPAELSNANAESGYRGKYSAVLEGVNCVMLTSAFRKVNNVYRLILFAEKDIFPRKQKLLEAVAATFRLN